MDATATVQVAALTPAQWAAANFKSEVTGVVIAGGPPVVSFTVSDALGNPVVGLENFTAQSATATLPSYPNFTFALAKLVPATTSNPSKWVSYIVTTVPTKNATTGVVTAAAPRTPTTDNTGKLESVAGTPGAYKYTFYRDVTTIKAQVDAMTVTAPNDKAALGDLTFEPTLPHRLTIQFSGAARGTGGNTANAVTVTPAVNLSNPLNVIYDFVPETGKPIAKADLTRQVVSIDSCNVCHERLALHGNRIDTEYCVVCHTDQLGYGSTNTASSSYYFNKSTFKETATTNATTGITSFAYAPATNIADGAVAGEFVNLVHKFHQGGTLVKQNYNFANLAFNLKNFSKLDNGQRMCTTCHDSSKATNADNWKTAPSAHACGACHDGINFADDSGVTLADKAADVAAGAAIGTTHTGHGRNGLAPTASCSVCHEAATIAESHQTTNITKNNPAIAAGLVTFTYEIKSVAVASATNDVTIEFRILQRAAPSTTDTAVTFLPAAAGMANPLTGFTGSPGFLLAYATTQDGILTPADYNNTGIKQAQPISVSVANLLDTTKTADGSIVASTTAGYYTATIKGTGTKKFPVGSKMRAVALQGYFTQVSAPATVAAPIARHAISVVKAVGGDTVRRTVADSAKCANCHEWFEGHGGNRVYEVQVCVMCHVPGLATSGRGISDAALAAYPFTAADIRILTDWKFDKTLPNAALNFPVASNNFKDMIHGIHSGRERVTPFQDARDRTPSAITLLDFRRMDFPGVLSNCNGCHVSSTTATTTYNTVAINTLVSTYESIDAAYAAAIAGGTATPALAKAALNTANATDATSSPFAAACVSCHDNTASRAHVVQNGGAIKTTRSAAVVAAESCAVCHGPGSVQDTAVVHK